MATEEKDVKMALIFLFQNTLQVIEIIWDIQGKIYYETIANLSRERKTFMNKGMFFMVTKQKFQIMIFSSTLKFKCKYRQYL